MDQFSDLPVPIDPAWTTFLQGRCQQQGIASWRALARRGQVSLWQVQQLRRGRVEQMRLAPLRGLAEALGVSLAELLAVAQDATGGTAQDTASQGPGGEIAAAPVPLAAPVDWQAECYRLQQRLDRQSQELAIDFQRQALAQLEPWLKNWPKVVHAATVTKPDLLAVKVLPLLAPLEALLRSWGITPIGAIGETHAYNPQIHTCLGTPPLPGDPVTIQRPGYGQGAVILHRAEVSAPG